MGDMRPPWMPPASAHGEAAGRQAGRQGPALNIREKGAHTGLENANIDALDNKSRLRLLLEGLPRPRHSPPGRVGGGQVPLVVFLSNKTNRGEKRARQAKPEKCSTTVHPTLPTMPRPTPAYFPTERDSPPSLADRHDWPSPASRCRSQAPKYDLIDDSHRHCPHADKVQAPRGSRPAAPDPGFSTEHYRPTDDDRRRLQAESAPP